MKKLLHRTFKAGLTLLLSVDAIAQVCPSTPSNQNFSGYTDVTYSQNTVTLNCIKYRINGGGTIGVDDKNKAATPTPEFSGNILLFLNDGTISATKCWFESTNTTINFKMKSFSVEFYDRSNGGSPQLYHIIGYDNGIEKVRVNNFDTKTAGLQGMGTSAVNFTKNAFSSDGSTSGKLEFGTGWQDVDKVEFEVAETNNNYKYLFVALDNIVFETAVPAVLPVSLVDFSVKTRNDHILVNFKTAKEENNDFFIVSSSTDGVNFKILQNIIASHEKTINSYNFVDLKPSQGTNYYKLQQKDKNGLVNDLGLKSIDFKLDETQSFSFYPNPVKERLNLTFEAGKFNAVKLVTTTGKLVFEEHIDSKINSTEINMSNFVSGVYLVILSGSHETIKQKIVLNK